MNGQLSEHPFAELLFEIQEKGLSGALRLERERVKAVVYFEDGQLVYATCNVLNLRLSEYAKKRGFSIDHIPAEARSSDFSLSASLLARGTVTQDELDKIIGEQVRDVVRVLLLWTTGDWNFEERARLTQKVNVKIEISPLLLDAARRLDARFVASRFTAETETISPGNVSPGQLNLSAGEGFLMSRMDSAMSLGQLVMLSGMSDLEARQIIYGLLLIGLLEREAWAYTFRANVARPKASKTPSRAVQPAARVEAPPRDPTTEVIEFLDLLSRATNHYEVLNIRVEAPASEVKSAYYGMARRYHPDRFHDLSSTDLHSKLESAFARITQAHEVLSDAESKAAYDAKLAALKRVGYTGTSTPGATRPAGSTEPAGADSFKIAEQRFQEGMAALKLGEMNNATAALSAAARLVPNQSKYRAYYGKALAGHPQTKRLAEAELQAAVKLDPANASYRVLLATLYRDLGFWRRAINELERALALDAKNIEARRMLQSLESKK